MPCLFVFVFALYVSIVFRRIDQRVLIVVQDGNTCYFMEKEKSDIQMLYKKLFLFVEREKQ